ncbi:MAG: hypothetical protein ACD_39C00022G0001, partial [uncultured bacterium]
MLCVKLEVKIVGFHDTDARSGNTCENDYPQDQLNLPAAAHNVNHERKQQHNAEHSAQITNSRGHVVVPENRECGETKKQRKWQIHAGARQYNFATGKDACAIDAGKQHNRYFGEKLFGREKVFGCGTAVEERHDQYDKQNADIDDPVGYRQISTRLFRALSEHAIKHFFDWLEKSCGSSAANARRLFGGRI